MKDIAMAVVIRKGCVLIQERFRRSQGMVFEFPGGTIDPNETGAVAAMRELREETGLNDLLWVATYKRPNGLGTQTYHVVLLAPEGVQPQRIEPARQQTFYWFKPSEIPRQDFYPADLAFLDQDLKKHL